MKKFLLLLLATVVVFTLLAVPVFADGLEPAETVNGTVFKASQALADGTVFPSGVLWSGRAYYSGDWHTFTNKEVKAYSDGSINIAGTIVAFYSVSQIEMETDSVVSFTVQYRSGGSVSTVPRYKDSAIASGFGVALSSIGDVFDLITSESLLPYIGLIIGISVLTAVLLYIKWLL